VIHHFLFHRSDKWRESNLDRWRIVIRELWHRSSNAIHITSLSLCWRHAFLAKHTLIVQQKNSIIFTINYGYHKQIARWNAIVNKICLKGNLKRKIVPLRTGRHVISWTMVETVIRTKSQVNSKALHNYSIMMFTFITYFHPHTAPGYAHCYRTAFFRTNQYKIVTFVEDFIVLGFYTGNCW